MSRYTIIPSDQAFKLAPSVDQEIDVGLEQKTSLINDNTNMWKDTIDTNVLGLCIATRESCKDMKVNNINGHIVQDLDLSIPIQVLYRQALDME